MFHVEFAPLGGIFGPLKSDLGAFWPFQATDLIIGILKIWDNFWGSQLLIWRLTFLESTCNFRISNLASAKMMGIFLRLDGSPGPMCIQSVQDKWALWSVSGSMDNREGTFSVLGFSTLEKFLGPSEENYTVPMDHPADYCRIIRKHCRRDNGRKGWVVSLSCNCF